MSLRDYLTPEALEFLHSLLRSRSRVKGREDALGLCTSLAAAMVDGTIESIGYERPGPFGRWWRYYPVRTVPSPIRVEGPMPDIGRLVA